MRISYRYCGNDPTTNSDPSGLCDDDGGTTSDVANPGSKDVQLAAVQWGQRTWTGKDGKPLKDASGRPVGKAKVKEVKGDKVTLVTDHGEVTVKISDLSVNDQVYLQEQDRDWCGRDLQGNKVRVTGRLVRVTSSTIVVEDDSGKQWTILRGSLDKKSLDYLNARQITLRVASDVDGKVLVLHIKGGTNSQVQDLVKALLRTYAVAADIVRAIANGTLTANSTAIKRWFGGGKSITPNQWTRIVGVFQNMLKAMTADGGMNFVIEDSPNAQHPELRPPRQEIGTYLTVALHTSTPPSGIRATALWRNPNRWPLFSTRSRTLGMDSCSRI